MSAMKNGRALKDVHDSSSNQRVDNNGMLAHKKQKKSSVIRNPFVILGHFFLMLMLVVILAVSIPLYIGKTIFEGKGTFETEQVVLIYPGMGIREIASLLEKHALIRSSDVFVYGVGYHQKTTHLKAGEYLIPAHASMQDIMDIFVKGKSIEYTFTVPEGLTVQQVFDRLIANEILVGDLPKALPPEGSLMTDTVHFIRGTTRKEIINRLREGQTKLVHAIWAMRSPDLPIKSIDEFVILASIVEKETGIAAERPKIAAVFYNRLAKHMRLQSDPTVIYGLFGGKGLPAGRAIYRSDLEKETPYNTYKIYGLPPTAIANPGKDSLKAVAHSPKSDVLYFVADGSGGHVFSRTLEEHNINVRKWRALKAAAH
ncbi:endolytic transglycosylase MltG [Bartonella rattaustraliani]|uniref:endolytic transglycosylase MltG n=1 Tax=Bartonella rattaustraliani TaxID=481139 RepID=UPI00030A113A|nr:endolytic transglycosylase MltG [Bartonella rattaustraliani]